MEFDGQIMIFYDDRVSPQNKFFDLWYNLFYKLKLFLTGKHFANDENPQRRENLPQKFQSKIFTDYCLQSDLLLKKTLACKISDYCNKSLKNHYLHIKFHNKILLCIKRTNDVSNFTFGEC